MSADFKEVLEFEFRKQNLSLQFHESKDQLSVVINRPPTVEVDADKTAIALLDKLNSFNLPHERYKITVRIEKEAKPEWQQVFENPNVKKGGGFLGGIFGKKK